MQYRGYEAFSDETNILLHFQNLELELRHAIQISTWAEICRRPGITNAVKFHSPFPYMGFYAEYSDSLDFLLAATASKNETERRIIVTAIALERYRGRHGIYPATLASLAPEFLPAVPVDFMDGKPLRYRFTDGGQFVLYSVGLDCVDDGGKLAQPDASGFPEYKGGKMVVPTNADIVWPRPDVVAASKP